MYCAIVKPIAKWRNNDEINMFIVVIAKYYKAILEHCNKKYLLMDRYCPLRDNRSIVARQARNKKNDRSIENKTLHEYLTR